MLLIIWSHIILDNHKMKTDANVQKSFFIAKPKKFSKNLFLTHYFASTTVFDPIK